MNPEKQLPPDPLSDAAARDPVRTTDGRPRASWLRRRDVLIGLGGGLLSSALGVACRAAPTPAPTPLAPAVTSPTPPATSAAARLPTATIAPEATPLGLPTVAPPPTPRATREPPTPTKPARESTFVGTWPYDLPPTGHFNVFAPGAIDLGIYRDLWQLPLAKYYWATNTYLPLLATSWGFNPPDKFTVRLRPGLSWSDGKALTARDLATTLWCWRIVGHPVWDYADGIETPDDSTATLHLKAPSTLVERLTLELNVVPSSDYGPYAKLAEVFFAAGKDPASNEGKMLARELADLRPKLPLSSGPYAIDPESLTKTRVVLTKEPTGWGADRVGFDRIVLYNGDTATVTPPMIAKLIDYTVQDLTPITVKTLGDERIRVQPAPTYQGQALGVGYGKSKMQSLLGDKRVRQAVAQALNGDEAGLAAHGVAGTGIRTFAGFSELLVTRWLTKDQVGALTAYGFSPPKAASILDELGWTKGADGVYATGDGVRAELELASSGDEVGQAAPLIARQLTELGIKTTVRDLDAGQWASLVDQGDFELAMLPWGASQPHPYFSFAADLFAHNLAWASGHGGKGIDFPLKQATDAVGEIDLAATIRGTALGLDPAAQKAAVFKMARAFNELLPIIPVYERWTRSPLLDGVRVTGWRPPGDPIYQNDAQADSFVVMQILDGTLKGI